MERVVPFLLVALAVAISSIDGADVPTLYPADPFDPSVDAQRLRSAMAGLGTDEAAIIDVLCHRAVVQRDTITHTYSTSIGRNLASDLSSDLSGLFKDICIKLTYGLTEFLVYELNETMKGIGTDEASLTEILISRSNQELADVRDLYPKLQGHTLAAQIESEFSGSEMDLMITLSEGTRDESVTDPNDVNLDQVQIDVTKIHFSGPAIPGTDNAVFVLIFSQRSWPHLIKVADSYYEQYGVTMETVLQTEFVGALQDSFLSILKYARNKHHYFAERLRGTMDTNGTYDWNLIRLVVSRCEIDLESIKIEYEGMYGHTLANDVSKDTSGDYRNALLALIN